MGGGLVKNSTWIRAKAPLWLTHCGLAGLWNPKLTLGDCSPSFTTHDKLLWHTTDHTSCKMAVTQSRNAYPYWDWKLNEWHLRSQGYYGNGWELSCYMGQKQAKQSTYTAMWAHVGPKRSSYHMWQPGHVIVWQIHDNIASRPTPEDENLSTSWKTNKLARSSGKRRSHPWSTTAGCPATYATSVAAD